MALRQTCRQTCKDAAMKYTAKCAFLASCLVFLSFSCAYPGTRTLSELFNPEVMQRELGAAFAFANHNEYDFDRISSKIIQIREDFFALVNAKPPAWEEKAFGLFQEYINFIVVRFSMLASGIVMNRKETQESLPLTISYTWPLFDELVAHNILKCDRAQYENAYIKYVSANLTLNRR